ncbi:MAG: Na+/H+ antiporter subunit [Ramlibacter sp.]|jgi:multicomponent K+:H+ antiporter subunit G|nr:Na+/H+ antiporter subunit [Ramlibacter sp.]
MIVDAVVALLLLASGVLVLAAATGLLRLPDFALRMHAPALANTLGSWAVTLASVVHLTAATSRLALHHWAIIILLAITVPVTTALLARAGLFRDRSARVAE